MKKIYIVLSVIIILCNGCSNAKAISDSNDINKDMEKADKVQWSEDGDSSGLLLGLKKINILDEDPTEYETIWIAQANEGFVVRRGQDFLSIPYGDDFYKIKNKVYEEKKLFDDVNKKSEELTLFDYEYKINFIDTVAHPFDKDGTQIYKEKIGWGDGYWPIRTEKDEILFAGNQYIMINRQYYETGGGTFRSSWYSNSLYDIKNLDEEYKKSSVDLYDYFEEDKVLLENMKKEHKKDLNNEQETNSFVTLEQELADTKPFLERKNGQWTVMIPIEQEFNHGGNGSIHTAMVDSIEVSKDVSNKLLCFDELSIPFEAIKRQIPDARDAITSPNENFIAILVKDRIDIYINQDGNKLGRPDLSLAINEDQTIVSNQWATGKYVEKWDGILGTLLVEDKDKMK